MRENYIYKLDFVGEKFDDVRGRDILVVGAGGTGSNLVFMLVRSGFTNVTVVDFDKVEEGNLGRQAFMERQIGMYKTEALKELCEEINPRASLSVFNCSLGNGSLELLKGRDLIVDCTDNFETRKLINDFCEKNGKDWLYNGAIRSEFVSYLFKGKMRRFDKFFRNPGDVKASDVGILPSTPVFAASLAYENILKYFLGKEIEFTKVDFWHGICHFLERDE